jgi:hypothetical protein
MNESALLSRCDRWQQRALIAGAVAAVISVVGAFFNHTQFFRSYLFAWLFWSGLSFGALVIAMMQFLTGGIWGRAVRGLATAAFRTLPLMSLLFLPVLIGVHDIFGWANGANGETSGYHHKAQYLNVPFFTVRAVFYFVVICVIGALLRRWSLALVDSTRMPKRLTALCSGGLIAFVLCMNFASTDWVMSLDPKWYSTIFVEVFIVGQFLSALALLTALLTVLATGDQVPEKAFHDLGNMLLAFVIFWAYVSFSQFLIIWSGNLPKEIGWYLDRSRNGWQWTAGVLALCQFFLPFVLLLSRAAKRNRQRLLGIALVIFLANVLAVFWQVAPSFHPAGFFMHWLDVAEWLALGGFWFALFFYFLKQRPLFPVPLTEEKQNG